MAVTITWRNHLSPDKHCDPLRSGPPNQGRGFNSQRPFFILDGISINYQLNLFLIELGTPSLWTMKDKLL